MSHVNAHAMGSVGDLFDMSEAQARCTLENWWRVDRVRS